MVLTLAQVAESADDYDSATIALFVVFIVALSITAGLILREIMVPKADTVDDSSAWPAQEPFPTRLDPPASLLPIDERHWIATGHPPRATPGGSPAWFSQAMSSQRTGAAQAIASSVERLIEASNRGDLRAGFSCYTPEHLARYQQDLGADAGELERLARMDPVPAGNQISVLGIRDVTIDPPYRAFATVDYSADDGSHRPSERYRFQFDRASETWLIDAIDVLAE